MEVASAVHRDSGIPDGLRVMSEQDALSNSKAMTLTEPSNADQRIDSSTISQEGSTGRKNSTAQENSTLATATRPYAIRPAFDTDRTTRALQNLLFNKKIWRECRKVLELQASTLQVLKRWLSKPPPIPGIGSSADTRNAVVAIGNSNAHQLALMAFVLGFELAEVQAKVKTIDDRMQTEIREGKQMAAECDKVRDTFGRMEHAIKRKMNAVQRELDWEQDEQEEHPPTIPSLDSRQRRRQRQRA
ncbi:unnamed protein product [Zymoseptoria tritici ST99CH_1E4]|uniref:Uncharacterized protein n=1 Tax=Zymoseptoria tritici ST99CH_1E4 TaxID=1276532 RepID=A0A2H1H9Z5_ZYMTR|nr:unnamed protein product [Zymoseptoria tritici ST99CH_1E4]